MIPVHVDSICQPSVHWQVGWVRIYVGLIGNNQDFCTSRHHLLIFVVGAGEIGQNFPLGFMDATEFLWKQKGFPKISVYIGITCQSL